MQRVVNGHYADPNSSRDLIGITPKQFEEIVQSLKEMYKGLEVLFSAKPSDRIEIFKSEMFGDLLPEGISPEDAEKKIITETDHAADRMNTIYEILKDINQPYPGAEY